jgi:hypothetical protein
LGRRRKFAQAASRPNLLVVPVLVILNLLSGSASRRDTGQPQASFIACLGNGREHLVGEVV